MTDIDADIDPDIGLEHYVPPTRAEVRQAALRNEKQRLRLLLEYPLCEHDGCDAVMREENHDYFRLSIIKYRRAYCFEHFRSRSVW